MGAWRGRSLYGTEVTCGVPGGPAGPCVLWNDHVGDVHSDKHGNEWIDKVTPRRTSGDVDTGGRL